MAQKVLVVDDEEDVLRVLRFRLEKKGYQVITAADGRSGLDKIASEKPDLILLDLVLPVLSGREICLKLKSDDNLKVIPVIIITASATGKVDDKIKNMEADDYVIKPFVWEELFNKIEGFLGRGGGDG